MELDQNEIYKFLGVERVDGINTTVVFERVKSEIEKKDEDVNEH